MSVPMLPHFKANGKDYRRIDSRVRQSKLKYGFIVTRHWSGRCKLQWCKKEQLQQYNKEKYQKNKEHYKRKNRENYQKNKESILKKGKEWRAKHKDRLKKQRKLRYQNSEHHKIKKELSLLPEFGGVCFVCGCENYKGGMLFHHIWYIENDVKYSNYSTSVNGQIQYYNDLKPLIIDNPKRFLYLCKKDHFTLTRILQYKKLDKLFEAALLTLECES